MKDKDNDNINYNNKNKTNYSSKNVIFNTKLNKELSFLEESELPTNSKTQIPIVSFSNQTIKTKEYNNKENNVKKCKYKDYKDFFTYNNEDDLNLIVRSKSQIIEKKNNIDSNNNSHYCNLVLKAIESLLRSSKEENPFKNSTTASINTDYSSINSIFSFIKSIDDSSGDATIQQPEMIYIIINNLKHLTYKEMLMILIVLKTILTSSITNIQILNTSSSIAFADYLKKKFKYGNNTNNNYIAKNRDNEVDNIKSDSNKYNKYIKYSKRDIYNDEEINQSNKKPKYESTNIYLTNNNTSTNSNTNSNDVIFYSFNIINELLVFLEMIMKSIENEENNVNNLNLFSNIHIILEIIGEVFSIIEIITFNSEITLIDVKILFKYYEIFYNKFLKLVNISRNNKIININHLNINCSNSKLSKYSKSKVKQSNKSLFSNSVSKKAVSNAYHNSNINVNINNSNNDVYYNKSNFYLLMMSGVLTIITKSFFSNQYVSSERKLLSILNNSSNGKINNLDNNANGNNTNTTPLDLFPEKFFLLNNNTEINLPIEDLQKSNLSLGSKGYFFYSSFRLEKFKTKTTLENKKHKYRAFQSFNLNYNNSTINDFSILKNNKTTLFEIKTNNKEVLELYLKENSLYLNITNSPSLQKSSNWYNNNNSSNNNSTNNNSNNNTNAINKSNTQQTPSKLNPHNTETNQDRINKKQSTFTKTSNNNIISNNTDTNNNSNNLLEKKSFFLTNIDYNKWTSLVINHIPGNMIFKPEITILLNDSKTTKSIEFPSFSNHKVTGFSLFKNFYGQMTSVGFCFEAASKNVLNSFFNLNDNLNSISIKKENVDLRFEYDDDDFSSNNYSNIDNLLVTDSRINQEIVGNNVSFSGVSNDHSNINEGRKFATAKFFNFNYTNSNNSNVANSSIHCNNGNNGNKDNENNCFNISINDNSIIDNALSDNNINNTYNKDFNFKNNTFKKQNQGVGYTNSSKVVNNDNNRIDINNNNENNSVVKILKEPQSNLTSNTMLNEFNSLNNNIEINNNSIFNINITKQSDIETTNSNVIYNLNKTNASLSNIKKQNENMTNNININNTNSTNINRQNNEYQSYNTISYLNKENNNSNSGIYTNINTNNYYNKDKDITTITDQTQYFGIWNENQITQLNFLFKQNQDFKTFFSKTLFFYSIARISKTKIEINKEFINIINNNSINKVNNHEIIERKLNTSFKSNTEYKNYNFFNKSKINENSTNPMYNDYSDKLNLQFQEETINSVLDSNLNDNLSSLLLYNLNENYNSNFSSKFSLENNSCDLSKVKNVSDISKFINSISGNTGNSGNGVFNASLKNFSDNSFCYVFDNNSVGGCGSLSGFTGFFGIGNGFEILLPVFQSVEVISNNEENCFLGCRSVTVSDGSNFENSCINNSNNGFINRSSNYPGKVNNNNTVDTTTCLCNDNNNNNYLVLITNSMLILKQTLLLALEVEYNKSNEKVKTLINDKSNTQANINSSYTTTISTNNEEYLSEKNINYLKQVITIIENFSSKVINNKVFLSSTLNITKTLLIKLKEKNLSTIKDSSSFIIIETFIINLVLSKVLLNKYSLETKQVLLFELKKLYCDYFDILTIIITPEKILNLILSYITDGSKDEVNDFRLNSKNKKAYSNTNTNTNININIDSNMNTSNISNLASTSSFCCVDHYLMTNDNTNNTNADTNNKTNTDNTLITILSTAPIIEHISPLINFLYTILFYYKHNTFYYYERSVKLILNYIVLNMPYCLVRLFLKLLFALVSEPNMDFYINNNSNSFNKELYRNNSSTNISKITRAFNNRYREVLINNGAIELLLLLFDKYSLDIKLECLVLLENLIGYSCFRKNDYVSFSLDSRDYYNNKDYYEYKDNEKCFDRYVIIEKEARYLMNNLLNKESSLINHKDVLENNGYKGYNGYNSKGGGFIYDFKKEIIPYLINSITNFFCDSNKSNMNTKTNNNNTFTNNNNLNDQLIHLFTKLNIYKNLEFNDHYNDIYSNQINNFYLNSIYDFLIKWMTKSSKAIYSNMSIPLLVLEDNNNKNNKSNNNKSHSKNTKIEINHKQFNISELNRIKFNFKSLLFFSIKSKNIYSNSISNSNHSNNHNHNTSNNTRVSYTSIIKDLLVLNNSKYYFKFESNLDDSEDHIMIIELLELILSVVSISPVELKQNFFNDIMILSNENQSKCIIIFNYYHNITILCL